MRKFVVTSPGPARPGIRASSRSALRAEVCCFVGQRLDNAQWRSGVPFGRKYLTPSRILAAACTILIAAVVRAQAPPVLSESYRAAEPAYLPDSARPAIHGPVVIGCSPGKAFSFRVPATGTAPLIFAASGLPAGLAIDAQTGTIIGRASAAGTSTVALTVSNSQGRVTGSLRIICAESKIALTPPMGWQAFGIYGDAVTDAQVRSAADNLVKSGLAAHGYQYVNLGDTWQGARDAAGNLHPNRRFPDMKALGDYLHSKGLKFGLYSAATTQTCSGFAGSEGHEAQDAKDFADWGVDFLSYDWCPDAAGVSNISAASLQAKFAAMGDALRKTNRDIIFSVAAGKRDPEPAEWAVNARAQIFELQGGLYDDQKILRTFALVRSQYNDRVAPGYWNFLGPLYAGRIGFPKPHLTKLTSAEQMTQVSLWSLLSSPLMISCDLAHLDPNLLNHETTALLTNDEVLAVDQDPKGDPMTQIGPDYGHLIWKKTLSDGRIAVGIFNSNAVPERQSIRLADLGLTGSQPVRDLWQRRDLPPMTDEFTAVVPPHGVVLIAVGRAGAAPATP
jgi:alpha-galactosidase